MRRRPFHHSPRFQLTQVASARLSAIAEPNRNAATCNTAIAIPNPIKPQPEFAITHAPGHMFITDVADSEIRGREPQPAGIAAS